MKLIFGYQDTRVNHEDFAITPFLGAVYVKKRAYGISVCWGFWDVMIAIGFRIPKCDELKELTKHILLLKSIPK